MLRFNYRGGRLPGTGKSLLNERPPAHFLSVERDEKSFIILDKFYAWCITKDVGGRLFGFSGPLSSAAVDRNKKILKSVLNETFPLFSPFSLNPRENDLILINCFPRCCRLQYGNAALSRHAAPPDTGKKKVFLEECFTWQTVKGSRRCCRDADLGLTAVRFLFSLVFIVRCV